MRSTLHSLVLVQICAILFISCSKKQKIISRSVSEINYTLGASEEPEVFPQVNNYASLQMDYTLKEIMEKYSPKEQEFIIEPTLSSAIKCKSGTVIKFEPDIFIYADSRLPVSEEIEIKVTEYLSDADILFKGLTTMCKNELIETAGMLYVTATANGKLCGIKNGEVYNIEIPSVSEKENMELFYGEATADGINWVNASKAKFMGSEGINLFDRINYVWQKKGPTMFEGGIGALYEYLHANYVFPNGFENVELKGTSYLNFTINYEGELTDIFTPVEYKTYADSQLITAFKKSPDWNVSLKEGDYRKKMRIPIKMNWVRDPTLIPAKLIAESMPERDHFSAFYDTDRYLLVSSKLGWINCDRFTEPGIVKTDLFVSVDSLFDATVRIVFNNIRSVMGGVRFTKGFNFNKIPDDESITIFAVRINNEVSELAIKECNTGSGTINDLVWYPADKNEMKRQFDNLDVENDLAMR